MVRIYETDKDVIGLMRAEWAQMVNYIEGSVTSFPNKRAENLLRLFFIRYQHIPTMNKALNAEKRLRFNGNALEIFFPEINIARELKELLNK